MGDLGGGHFQLTLLRTGFKSRDATSLLDPNVASEITDPAHTTVMALDLPVPGSPRRGVVFNTTTRALVDVLRVDATGKITMQSPTALTTGADPPGRPVVEVSNRRQEAAFFDDRDASGALLPRVRLFDFVLQQPLEKTILGRNKLHEPLAAAYRAADDAYYVLDRTREHGHATIRLVRIPSSYTVEVIAEWPDTNAFADHFLTASADGTLIVTGSSSHHHGFAILALDHMRPRLRMLDFGSGQVVVPAYASRLSIMFVRVSSTGEFIPDEVRRPRRATEQRGRGEGEHQGRGSHEGDDDPDLDLDEIA